MTRILLSKWVIVVDEIRLISGLLLCSVTDRSIGAGWSHIHIGINCYKGIQVIDLVYCVSIFLWTVVAVLLRYDHMMWPVQRLTCVLIKWLLSGSILTCPELPCAYVPSWSTGTNHRKSWYFNKGKAVLFGIHYTLTECINNYRIRRRPNETQDLCNFAVLYCTILWTFRLRLFNRWWTVCNFSRKYQS